jgi:predicted DNA-binding transcriptional regulator YafY
VSPYKIVQDDTKSYNYLIGLAEEIKEDGTTKEKKVSSFRISRIDKIKKMSSMGGFISKENKDKIEDELIHKKAQFMVGDIIDVKVRFTRKGIESFKRQLYLRPQFYEKSKTEDCVYTFKCTARQAMNYFFKFARDVEILEPEDLREKFVKRYSEALANYKLDEE